MSACAKRTYGLKQHNKNEQIMPIHKIAETLYRLCVECRSATLYIATDTGQGAAFSLSRGNIVDIAYRNIRGMLALEKIRMINRAKSIFKSDSSLRDNRKRSDNAVFLPANNVILNKLGMETSHMFNSLGSEIKKILIVDDSAMSRKVISSVFAGKSYEVTEAIDGFDAIEKLKQDVPDLVLLDLILPNFDGYEVLGIMKKSSVYKNIPVIMLTSRDALFDKLKGKMSETDEYLTKPVDAKTLMQKVNKYLN